MAMAMEHKKGRAPYIEKLFHFQILSLCHKKKMMMKKKTTRKRYTICVFEIALFSYSSQCNFLEQFREHKMKDQDVVCECVSPPSPSQLALACATNELRSCLTLTATLHVARPIYMCSCKNNISSLD